LRRLGRLISILVGLSVRGFFEAGWTGFRRSHPAAKLLIAPLGIALVYLHAAKGAAIVEAVIAVLLALSGDPGWALSLEALLLLPAAWAAASSLALSILGVSPITPTQALEIMLRYHAAGLAIAYPAATINPMDAYNAAARLTSPGRAAAILAAYRLLPHGLNTFREAIETASTKNPPIHSALAAATAAVLEEAEGVIEAAKYRAPRTRRVRLERDWRWTLLEAAAAAILAATLP